MDIKKLRLQKGYSQSEIASKLGIPLRTYKRLENSHSSNNTYKHEMIYERISNFKDNKSIKNIKKETIGIIGINEKSFLLGMALSLRNKIVFIDDNALFLNKVNSGICISKDEDALKVFEKKKTRIKAYKDPKILTICDSIILYCSKENIDEKMHQIYEYIDKKCLVIKGDISYQLLNDINGKYKNVEIVYYPDIVENCCSLKSLLNLNNIVFGVKRKNLKNKRMAMIVENMTNNSVKTTFLSYEEATKLIEFIAKYNDLRRTLISELKSASIEQNFDFKSVMKSAKSIIKDEDIFNEFLD